MDELRFATRDFSTANVLRNSRRDILRKPGIGHPGVYKVPANVLTPQRVVVIDLGLLYDNTMWLEQAVYLETKKHPNLVKLVGFCNETPHKMLVYEYVPSNSLQYYLVNNLLGRLSWLRRLKIAIGAAQGLNFLYEAGTPMHYYGSFRASKIMLDSDYTAKLSGFVLQAMGIYSMDFDDDVYNFGVVLLELLTGRPSINKQGHGRGASLVRQMLPRLESKDELQRVMDPSLEGRCSMTAAWNMARIVRRCCSDRSSQNRPSMREIVGDLEDIARAGNRPDRRVGKEKREAKSSNQTKLKRWTIK